MNGKEIEEMANCDKCCHNEICCYRKNAFQEGFISFESHMNKVKKLGCIHYQPKLPEDSVVLTREEYENAIKDWCELKAKIRDMYTWEQLDTACRDTANAYQSQIDELEEELDMLVKEQKEDRSYEIEQAQKERTREILQELFVFFPKDKQFTTISRATILSLAKQYEVEVEE